jgi:hypothetical protein
MNQVSLDKHLTRVLQPFSNGEQQEHEYSSSKARKNAEKQQEVRNAF